MNEEIINDYRDDWIRRCVGEKSIQYKQLDGSHFFVRHSNNELYGIFASIVEAACKAHGISIVISELSADADSAAAVGSSIAFVWDFEDCRTSDNNSGRFSDFDKIIYATDGKIAFERGLSFFVPYVYGAAFSDAQPRENACVNILDFFVSQLFAAADYENIPRGLYYAGHGSSGREDTKELSEYGCGKMISFEDGSYMLSFYRDHPDKLFYFDNTYGGKLQLLHELLFKLLCEFDRICSVHGIEYFLGGGTLLGAVRHKGMIPWDDDIDVMMLRGEYEKLLRVIEQETDSEVYFFQSSETDKAYHSVFTKLRLNGTSFVTRFSKQFDMHQGIFIDIFVHDETARSPFLQKLHVFRTLLARSMVFHKWAGTPMHFYGKLKFICKAATGYIKRTDIKKLEEKQHKVITRYCGKGTGFLYDGTGEHLRHGAFPAQWLEKAVYAEFSGKKFPIPHKYDEYLSYSYKDWKTLIPASLRKAGHDITEVSFGEYDKIK